MAEKTEIAAEAAAEKAYAAAAQGAKPEVVFPSKAKRAVQPETAATDGSVPLVPFKEAPAAPAKRAAKKKPAFNPAAAEAIVAEPATHAVVTPQILLAQAAPEAAAEKTLFRKLKDKTMETTDFTSKIKTAVGEAQTKAKEAFDKGAATFAGYNEFSKGNVEAVVASGKILAAGVQSLGKTFVDDGKNAFETLTAEVKELAAVRSPVDFFKLQAEFMRRNFDIAVSNTSKNSEALLKLASEAAAPISARVNLAVEKVKQAA